MSDQRIPISQLSETQTAPDASYIAIDDGSLTKKITVENFNSTSTASAQQYANQAAASAQTVEDNIATSAAQIREATLAAREATQASTSATASATSAYDSASLAQNYSVNAATSAGQAMNAADTVAQGVTESKEYAEDSEAWAVGKRNGSDVPASDETYQNNAKYYASNASGSATRAEAAAQSITVPDTTLTVSGVAADSKATGDRISAADAELVDIRVMADGTTAATAGAAVREQITELKENLNNIVEDTMSVDVTGSYYDFSEYIGKPLFGANGMFSGSGDTFDIDISGLDLAGKTISTYIWINALEGYIDGKITEIQMDEDGEQIYPTEGYHYVAHTMTILSECKTIRLKATQNAYSAWPTATVTHAQLYTTGAEQVDYSVKYVVDDMAIVESVDSLKNTIGAEEVVTSNNQIDPSPVIGKTFGSVNDSIHLFPFGKTLAELGNGYTNFVMHLNTGSISGYFQLIKENGTTDNSNRSFNTATYAIANVVNPNLVRGVKIHCYSVASGVTISTFGLTFNGLPVDTFATGIRSNINPKSWDGKKWVAYGDSITQGGQWERIVVKRTGLLLTNSGVGGSSVADVTGASVASFTDPDRIAAIPSDADVVTIMGGTNDYAGNVPIGDVPTTTPFDKTTFIGALCETVRLVQTQCPDALIVIMSNVGGRGTQGVAGEIPPRNSIGLSSSDYALGAERVASFMGCPFVDVHRCGITPMNRVKYISDSVHPNEAGAELIARKVIDYLVNNYPAE